MFSDYITAEWYPGYIIIGLGYEEEDIVNIYQRFAITPQFLVRIIKVLEAARRNYEERYGSIPPIESRQEPPRELSGAGVKICPECGHENKPEAKFCVNCGARLC